MSEALYTFERLCRKVGGEIHRVGDVVSCVLPEDSSVKLDFSEEELEIELFSHGEIAYGKLPAREEIDISVERPTPVRGVGGHFSGVDWFEKVGGKLPYGGIISIEIKNGKVKAVSIRPK